MFGRSVDIFSYAASPVMLHFPGTVRLGGPRVGYSWFCEALLALVLLLGHLT